MCLKCEITYKKEGCQKADGLLSFFATLRKTRDRQEAMMIIF